jgi:hypothetical protein
MTKLFVQKYVKTDIYGKEKKYGKEEKNMVSGSNLSFDGTWSAAASHISG